MDYSRTASLSSHSGIVSGGEEANWFSSCSASAAHSHSDSWVCLNTVMNIPSGWYTRGTFTLRFKATFTVFSSSPSSVTDHKQAHLSHSALQLLQNVIHQRAAVTIMISVSQTCSCKHVQVELCDCYQSAPGRREEGKGDFTADFSVKVKDLCNQQHKQRQCCKLTTV